MNRRHILQLGAKLGMGLTGGTFVLARSGLTVATTPFVESDEVPAEPSFEGTLIYGIAMLHQYVSPIQTVAQERAIPPTSIPLPRGISLKKVNAAGVPAQLICSVGALKNRVILYVHGGGWAVPLQDQDRVAASQLSQAIGACVLLPEYRLAPEHPFPDGLNDCLTAYLWLRDQGVAASQIVVIGGSAGGNLTLALAIALRERREPLPAALVAMSPPTDLAMTGKTYTTRAAADPVLGGELAKNSYLAYTNNGRVDTRNPLVSPLYADLHGLPPTLLQVGTQEVLLSDVTRLAERLQAAGVQVELEIWPGMFHGWNFFGDFLPESRLAIQHIVKYIRHHLTA